MNYVYSGGIAQDSVIGEIALRVNKLSKITLYLNLLQLDLITSELGSVSKEFITNLD